MYSNIAKKVAFYVAFAWVAYGIVTTLMGHGGIEKALIKAAVPGGLLLIAALIAHSAPRVGSVIIIGLGVVMFIFIKQETMLKSLIVSVPLIMVGLFVITSEVLDNMRK